MTGDVHPSPDALNHEVVHIQHFGKLRGHGFQSMLELGVADDFFRLFDCGRFALDVRKNVGNFGHIATHVCLKFRDLIMRFLERHPLVQFHMLFHVQASIQVLHADVMHVEVLMRGHGADPVKNILRMLRSRKRLDGYVGVRKHLMYRIGDGSGQLARALKRHSAGEAYRKISEKTVAGPADSNPIHFENAFHPQHCIVNLRSHSREAQRRAVHQSYGVLNAS